MKKLFILLFTCLVFTGHAQIDAGTEIADGHTVGDLVEYLEEQLLEAFQENDVIPSEIYAGEELVGELADGQFLLDLSLLPSGSPGLTVEEVIDLIESYLSEQGRQELTPPEPIILQKLRDAIAANKTMTQFKRLGTKSEWQEAGQFLGLDTRSSQYTEAEQISIILEVLKS